MFFEMMGYSIWSLFGSISAVARNQGINILLGTFFSPVVTAARAIAYQVSEAINQFSNNFFSAVSPQITKYYSAGEHVGMMNLVFRSTRFSFYILYLVALPIILETKYILSLWLTSPPEYSILFVRLIVFNSLIDSIGYPLMTAINATGKTKVYQIATGGVLILTLPIAYIFLKIGYPPESTLYVAILTSIAAQFSRTYFMSILHTFSVWHYFSQVITLVMGVAFTSAIVPLIALSLLPYGDVRFITVLLLSVLGCLFGSYSVGITKLERSSVNAFILGKLRTL